MASGRPLQVQTVTGGSARSHSARALVAYRTIVQQLDSTSAVGEAKVRIGELTKGAGAATVAK